MIEISHNTPLSKLNSLKIGDTVIDDYESSGKIVKITKAKQPGFIEFKLLLDNRQSIYLIKC
ncbi:hypothetical protein [Pedobacter agri]|uniref:Uncharacterized protein n=1 Tax=Pedobacter agri TaxID=454586 RepID=A0A9X3I9C8_9SPHI|nr:hypothetical protein [Pedobacter agri]MCX3264869.1 hypothetical protein [Pedobacter agri]